MLANPPLRVLVVEDEPALAMQLRAILSLDGHDVVVCNSGEAALAVLAGERFDLVMTDLDLAVVDGWGVAAEAKQRDPDVFVGLITGWAAQLTGDHANRGVDVIVPKPYGIQAIRNVITRVREAQAQREERPSIS